MDAGDLQGGFRLGDWQVQTRDGRISGSGGEHTLREFRGGSRHDHRCIVPVERSACALIANFEPLASTRDRTRSLFAELGRRNVFKVAGAYLVDDRPHHPDGTGPADRLRARVVLRDHAGRHRAG